LNLFLTVARYLKKASWGIIIWMGSLMVLGFVVAFAMYSFRIVEREMAAQFNREQELLAEQMAMGIQQYMNDIINVMTLTSRIKPVAAGDREQVTIAMKNAYTSLRNKVNFIFWEDASGIMQYHFPSDVLSGIDGKDFSYRTYFRVARQMKVPYVSDIILVGGKENPDIPGRFETFIIVFPLIGEDKRFNGAIGCAIDLKNITAQYVAHIQPSKTGYAWLVDESGMLLYHPDPALIGMNLHDVIMNMKKGNIPIQGVEKVSQEMEVKNSGSAEIVFPHYPNGDLTRKLLAFSSVHFLNRRWVTVVTSPYREVVYLMQGTFKNTLTLGSVSIAFIVIATLFLLRINRARTKADERNKWADQVITANKRLEAVFNGVPHFLVTVDDRMVIKDANENFCELYNRARTEIAGINCIDDFEEKQVFCPEEVIQACFDTGSIQTIRDRKIEFSTNRRWFDISAIPLIGASGNIELVVQYGVEITEKKALTEKLIQAEKLAAVGQISAHMAHEIRNPLTSIMLHSELLGDEVKVGLGENTEAMRLLKVVIDEIDRLSNITEEYLAYARLPMPKKQVIEADAAISSVLEMMLPEMHRRNINLKYTEPAKSTKINIDSGQFRQVLINLIKNAIDAMPSGGEIEVLMMERGKHLVLFIKDTGSGIPKDIKRRIFDPYFTTKDNGTGLGLYLVQYIANAHDGWVDVESQRGSGSNFMLTLPVYNEEMEKKNDQEGHN
jgi:PAS domain S-box-containing protein